VRRAASSAAADVVTVVVFVIIGRRSHDEAGNALAETAEVAAPFLLGLALAWVFAVAWRRPWTWRTGLVVWLGTVVVGLLLRRFVVERSTALSFAIVTTVVLGVLLNGWRAVARWRLSRAR
jgi:hypothetical protein